jgi:rhodanese-related sulfurtransferase
MKALVQLAVVLAVAFAAAGITYAIKGPPDRAVRCDPSSLQPDEVCLDRVMGEWNGRVLWVDARSRKEWERDGVPGSLLWNLDPDENMLTFEAEVAGRMIEGSRVVVYCSNENCGVSRQVAARINALQLGNEVHVLYGGWRALAAAKLTQGQPPK